MRKPTRFISTASRFRVRPDDGLVLMRPVTQPKTIFFGQLALGYSRDPLHTSNITNDVPDVEKFGNTAVIRDQFTEYATIGFQFLNRVTDCRNVARDARARRKSNPQLYGERIFGGTTASDSVQTGGPALDDLRLDAYAPSLRSHQQRARRASAACLELLGAHRIDREFRRRRPSDAHALDSGRVRFQIFHFGCEHRRRVPT